MSTCTYGHESIHRTKRCSNLLADHSFRIILTLTLTPKIDDHAKDEGTGVMV